MVLFVLNNSLSISLRWVSMVSIITHGTIKTCKNWDREKREKSFQSEDYLTTIGVEKEEFRRKKNGLWWSNFENSKHFLKSYFPFKKTHTHNFP